MAELANCIRGIHNHRLLDDWMTEADVRYVILKGCASSHYYPDQYRRSMGDVDFLVSPDDLEKAGEALLRNGLKLCCEESNTHIVYRAKKVSMEMHYNIAGTPEAEAGDIVKEYLCDIFDRSEMQSIGEGAAVMPSPFHHGLIMLLHMSHHMTGEGIGLRHLCDWAVFENRFPDEEFRLLFEDKLRKAGLWTFACVLTGIAVKYLKADEKEWAESDGVVVDALLEDIFCGGNFGIKDSSRKMQTVLISNRGKNGVGKKTMFSQFIESINRIIYLKWPSSKKNKLLLPVGWVYFGGRRFIRELFGKREKTDIRQVIDLSQNRIELYKKLHLFERES